MSKHVFVVLTNAAEGREEEFNTWYTKVHLADVLRVPGIVAAQRFTLSSAQRNPPPYPYKYLALYEIDSEDPAETMSTLSRRIGTPEMVVSDAMDSERSAWVFHAITPKITVSGPVED